MPILSNTRHERFAQELAKGKRVDEASEIAGIDLIEPHSLGGFYVYLLIDPRCGRVFYIGKGKNRRYASHERQARMGILTDKAIRIREIVSAGYSVECAFIADMMQEDYAYQLESALIRSVGFRNLTNVLPGTETLATKALRQVRENKAIIKTEAQILAEGAFRGYSADYRAMVRNTVVDGLDRIEAKLVSLIYGVSISIEAENARS